MRRVVQEARDVGLTVDTGALKALMQLSQQSSDDDMLRKVLAGIDRGEISSHQLLLKFKLEPPSAAKAASPSPSKPKVLMQGSYQTFSKDLKFFRCFILEVPLGDYWILGGRAPPNLYKSHAAAPALHQNPSASCRTRSTW